MDNENSLSPLNNGGYEELKFDVLTEIILCTQLYEKVIRKEYKKMKDFYLNHPQIFFNSLNDTKKSLELKDELTEYDKLTLESINEITDNHKDINCYFLFQEDYLLNSYQKIYSQMSKLNREFVKKTSVIELIFYSLTEEQNENILIGEKDEKRILNTGSRLKFEILKINTKNFIYFYQSLLN